MEPYILLLAGLGIVILAVSWLPRLVSGVVLPLPILSLALGLALFSIPGTGPNPDPIVGSEIVERLCEFVVIIALMGAGLKLDRPPGLRSWAITWRLLAVTMPLSIFGIAFVAWWLLGLHPVAALLLGAVLAPTDPVLAADVQVGPPLSGGEDDARFGLTSEAGLNDGLAFPFTNLAIAAAAAAAAGTLSDGWWLAEWLAVDVVWKIAAGVAVGWLVGWALGTIVFRLARNPVAFREGAGDGFAAVGITLLSYGATELAQGYGFVAVFVTALTLRHQERSHAYHVRLNDFVEQAEKLLTMGLLVLFGGSIAGGLLAPLTWQGAAVGILALLVVRPLTGIVGLAGSDQSWPDRGFIGFFGIRGIGSFYYLAYAINQEGLDDAQAEQLWAVVGFVVLMSILVHGLSARAAMRLLFRDGRVPGPAD